MAFKYYIDKGVTVCQEWRTFVPFSEWALSHGYADDLTLDRIESSGNYEPSNCQWISMAANLRKRTGVKFTMAKAIEVRRRRANGERAITLAAEFGVQANQIYRICSGQRWNEAING